MGRLDMDTILILVADDDETVRTGVARLLESHGYFVVQAVNSGAAIKVVREHDIDVAIIAHRMKPNDGFEIARHIMFKGTGVGVIMLTDDASTDLLLQAGQTGIGQVMKKPIDPERLVQMVKRVIRTRGKNPDQQDAEKIAGFSPDALMERAIALASQNAKARMGGPFGAVVADADGHILGEGVNAVHTRCDPTAHAEVMAIRRAAEKLNTHRLDGCVIYCSAEPTMLGQALIIGTGIKKVYYGISHAESGAPRAEEEGILGEIARPLNQRTVPYEQLRREQALQVFRDWGGQL